MPVPHSEEDRRCILFILYALLKLLAAVSDCTKMLCVRKVGEPRIRKLSAYEIFWIQVTVTKTTISVAKDVYCWRPEKTGEKRFLSNTNSPFRPDGLPHSCSGSPSGRSVRFVFLKIFFLCSFQVANDVIIEQKRIYTAWVYLTLVSTYFPSPALPSFFIQNYTHKVAYTLFVHLVSWHGFFFG